MFLKQKQIPNQILPLGTMNQNQKDLKGISYEEHHHFRLTQQQQQQTLAINPSVYRAPRKSTSPFGWPKCCLEVPC